MKFKLLALPLMAFICLSTQAHSATSAMTEELDPFASNIEERLKEMDAIYSSAGEKAAAEFMETFGAGGDCSQRTCSVFLDVDKATQRAQLFVDGQFMAEWKVSSGGKGHTTPNFDRHPNGRIYDKYSSSKFPGGDYNGFGNMPFVVFISGGFAVHGTPKGNWSKLGTAVSHGCIRVHPENAKTFNRLVRKYGVLQTWITIR